MHQVGGRQGEQGGIDAGVVAPLQTPASSAALCNVKYTDCKI